MNGPLRGEPTGSMHSVSNALRVLEVYLETGGGELGVNEMARLLGLGPSVAHRLMTTLREHGFLEQDPAGRKYRVGMKTLEVGKLCLRDRSFAPLVAQAVRDALPEYTSFVAIGSQGEIIVLSAVEGSGLIKIGAHTGERRPAHCTALGKALLATTDDVEVIRILAKTGMPQITQHTIVDPDALLEDLKRTRERGYAVNDEESIVGVVSIGVAVKDSFGRVLGATSVSTPRFLIDAQQIDEIGKSLQEIVTKLGPELDRDGRPVKLRKVN